MLAEISGLVYRLLGLQDATLNIIILLYFGMNCLTLKSIIDLMLILCCSVVGQLECLKDLQTQVFLFLWIPVLQLVVFMSHLALQI